MQKPYILLISINFTSLYTFTTIVDWLNQLLSSHSRPIRLILSLILSKNALFTSTTILMVEVILVSVTTTRTAPTTTCVHHQVVVIQKFSAVFLSFRSQTCNRIVPEHFRVFWIVVLRQWLSRRWCHHTTTNAQLFFAIRHRVLILGVGIAGVVLRGSGAGIAGIGAHWGGVLVVAGRFWIFELLGSFQRFPMHTLKIEIKG